MLRTITGALLILFICISGINENVAASDSKKSHPLAPVVIKMPGFNYEEEFPEKIEGDAWAVCKAGEKYELKPVKVKIKKIYSGCTEKMEPEPEVSGCGDYLFLVKGYKGFSPDTFATADVKEISHDSDNSIDWREQISMNGNLSELSRRKGKGDTVEIVFTSGEASQVIDKSDEGFTELIVTWAGDLDGDKKIDLLLQVGEGEAHSYSFYLSRYAKQGQLLKQVAREVFLSC